MRGMVTKPGSFFVVSFRLLFWGSSLHKTKQNSKCNSCIVSEHKTKDMQGQGPSNINLCLFVSLFDVYH